jgi:trans-aconitate 2-methyltransferase
MADWNAQQYLKFEDERTRPARDLLAQIPLADARKVVDIGCGPGNSTELLVNRWPQAAVTGVDTSADMLRQARERLPAQTFIEANIAHWAPPAGTDVMFANAVFQWVPDHIKQLKRLAGGLPPGGVLAVQMPAMHAQPLRQIPYDLAQMPPWSEYLRGVTSAPAILSELEYWDLMRPRVAALDMWQTTYMHALSGEHAVMEWASGSSLRAFLDRLPEALKGPFGLAYSEAARPHYPRRADGSTLLPFQRLFMVARV